MKKNCYCLNGYISGVDAAGILDEKIENLEKKGMSLAEIFNHNEDNGFTDEEHKRIRF